jgi:hypothetical protein
MINDSMSVVLRVQAGIYLATIEACLEVIID